MRLIIWLIFSVTAQAISGLPLLHRPARNVDHGKHLHRNNSTGRHRLHAARDDHAHGTHHAHGIHHAHHGHHGHGTNQPVKPHSHSGHHSHGRLRPTIQSKQNKESKVIYDVPKNKHFHSAAETGTKTNAHHTGHQPEPDLGLDFGLASILEIQNELLQQVSDNKKLKYTKNTPKKIETTTPSPSNWDMKNTVQVSDTRSFDTIFRQTVNSRKVPIKVKRLPSRNRKPNSRNQQNVIRYEDHGTRSISKRGIGRLGSSKPIQSAPNLSKNGFIENTLTVRVWNESRIGQNVKPGITGLGDRQKATRTTQKVLPVTASPRYTQGRLGRRITKQHTLSVNYATTPTPYKAPKTSRVEYTVKSKPTTTAPNVKPAEMVKLQGIHVMFSHAQQKKNNSVPTIHLTAAVDEQQNKQHIRTPKNLSPLNNLQSVINKIVGTAIIKDGHLYLIVYPFGESKSMNIRYPQNKSVTFSTNIVTSPSPNKTQLPTNKPIPIPGMGRQSESRPLRKPTSTPAPPLTALTSTLTMTTTMSSSSMEMNHHHGHHMHTMDHSMMGHGHTHTVPADKNIEKDQLIQVPRFMSPWKALNLSSIFPHPDNVSISDDEDTDVKVLPFVAQATDPFDKIKMILASLANQTDNATNPLPNTDGAIDPSADASFNFEVNIKGDLSANTQGTTTQKDKTSEERTTEYVKPVDSSKFTVTEPSISNTIPTTRRQKVFSPQKPETVRPTTERAKYSTASPKTSTTTSPTTATSHWLKSVDGSVTEQGISVHGLATAARISEDLNRKMITKSKPSSNPTVGTPSLGFGNVVTTSSQLDSAFNFNLVRQLHESENLMHTRQRFNFRTYRPTTEASITATPYGHSSFSHQGMMTTMTPLQAAQAFSMMDKELQSDNFKVQVRDKSLSNTVPSTIVSSKSVSGETSSNNKVLSDSLSMNKVKSNALSVNKVNTHTISRDKVPSDARSIKKVSSDKISQSPAESISSAINDASNRVQQAIVSPSLSQSVAERKAPKVGNNVDRTSHQLDRGQTEQIISLADVLTDIRKIQLHNMQRFNIHNNNFNTMLLSNTEMTPSLRPPVMSDRAVFNNYPRIPTRSPGTEFLPRPTARTLMGTNRGAWQRHETNRQKAMRDAIDAMLVLSVDDVVADHTNLHGALVLSQSRDPVSGSSSSSSSNK